MIKAGLFGMITFLPIGLDPWSAGGTVLIVIGLFTAFYGVICGVAQDDAKAVLAYSSLSQMGILAAALGVGWTAPAVWPALLVAVTVYMLHHGLTKGGLFLLVGARQKGTMTAGSRVAFILLASVGALALAGLPLSSGAVAKLTLKSAIEGASTEAADRIVTLLSLSAVATTLLVLRFLYIFAPWRPTANDGSAAGPARRILTGTAAASILAGQVAIWWIAPASKIADTFSAYGLWENGWPLAVGLGVAAASMLAVRGRQAWRVPQGDLLALSSPPAVALAASSVRLALKVSEYSGSAVRCVRSSVQAVWDDSVRRRSGIEDAVNRAVGQRAVTAISIIAVAAALFAVLRG
jgi:multicomponent Na+:H+ antiporter subunit D